MVSANLSRRNHCPPQRERSHTLRQWILHIICWLPTRCPSRPVHASGRMRSSPCSAPGAWGKSTKPATPAWVAPSRSRSCPCIVAATPNLSERFDREARAVAALKHPHICMLYDVGHHDGIDYLVMENWKGRRLPSAWKQARSRSTRRFSTRFRSPTRSTRHIDKGSSIAI